MTEQLPIDWQARRDQGIASSLNHAEQDVPGWGEQVLAYVKRFAGFMACEMGDAWTMEDCRCWSHNLGLPAPEELRSWGAVTQKAIRQGIIKPTGQYAPAASSNGSVKMLYVGCV